MKILIDNGSTNNFIKPSTMDRLKLKRSSTPKFKVGMGSEVFLKCNSKCEEVTLNIKEHKFTTDLFILEMKGSDIVLGVQWLIELGNIMKNYKEITMQFHYWGEEVKIQGESMLASTPLRENKISTD